jgi:hypothetical protein
MERIADASDNELFVIHPGAVGEALSQQTEAQI